MVGLFKLFIAAFVWLVGTIFFYVHPLPAMPTWVSSICAAVLLAGFVAHGNE